MNVFPDFSDEAESDRPSLAYVDLTEDGVALAFTERHKDQLKFDHDARRWYEWTGDIWREDKLNRAADWCREMSRQVSEGHEERQRARLRRRSFAIGVEGFARDDPAHAVRQDVWDTDPYMLGVPGGVVNLRSGELLGPDPKQWITKHAAVAPSDTSDCPAWLNFLNEVTGGDREAIEFLRRWCGYCLTGDTSEHALIFLYGPGGNGKSVFLNTISRILKDYATTAAMDTFTQSNGTKHPTDLAYLKGARLVTASETEEGKSWDEARIKRMTGGDPITARLMHQDFFTYLPQFKLTIVGNHAPTLANVDDAIRRRFNIVPFVHKPAKPDRDLESKLVAEWSAILRWMIEGAIEWQHFGLGQPASIQAATADYFSEQDLVQRWLDDNCILEPSNRDLWETSADLHSNFSDYAKANGETPWTMKRLSPRLRLQGLTSDISRREGKTVRAWQGVRLNKAICDGLE